MTLEALARLNYKLKMIGSDMTVVMFFITNRPCHSINPDVLNSRAVMEELRKSSEGMGRDVGEKLFNYLSSHSGNSNLPDLNDFINETTKFRIKRTLQSWNTNTLPPVVTHNIVDDYKDEILGFVRSAGLINKKDDRVKIVYHPAFISPDNPLFGIENTASSSADATWEYSPATMNRGDIPRARVWQAAFPPSPPIWPDLATT